MWETITELYKRLPKELAYKVIHAGQPMFDEEIVTAGE
jgi:hypothetical protein